MSDSTLRALSTRGGRRRSSDLVPRMKNQGYTRELVERRRQWAETRVGAELTHVGPSGLLGRSFSRLIAKHSPEKERVGDGDRTRDPKFHKLVL